MTVESPIVREVRDRATALSERYGNDLRRYVEHLREIEAREAHRVRRDAPVALSEQRNEDRKPAA